MVDQKKKGGGSDRRMRAEFWGLMALTIVALVAGVKGCLAW